MGCCWGNQGFHARASKREMVCEVMGQYGMLMDRESVMGEGTSSICRRGYVLKTGEPVAIKLYKGQLRLEGNNKVKPAILKKFQRQVQVLESLQKPFTRPFHPDYWCKELEGTSPSTLFMTLVDYSKDSQGRPGPDRHDGTLYVITELAQYSLKDLIRNYREQGKFMGKDVVHTLSRKILLDMAGLHAQGYVHLDMKPENLMFFNGNLKVIDVDGCVKVKSTINLTDTSISFSPCYCAPEWAHFLVCGDRNTLAAEAALDAWSVAMTICELVSRDPILRSKYAEFLRYAVSHKEASLHFMEWLAGAEACVPLPPRIEEHSPELNDLVCSWLLVGSSTRRTMAQCFSHDYLTSPKLQSGAPAKEPEHVLRSRAVDTTVQKPVLKGTLWKLNSNGDPMKLEHWVKRDMWVAHNYSLCYYSVRDSQRLVLIDGAILMGATVERLPAGSTPRKFAFSIVAVEDDQTKTFSLAADSQTTLDAWLNVLRSARRMDCPVTLNLGSTMAEDLKNFRVTVRNRRKRIDESAKDAFGPAFRANLWKLKADGNRLKMEDWFERDMWISKNGSLVYYSPKEQTDLVYYTAADVSRSKVVELGEKETCHPWAFQLVMPPINGVCVAPGEFAASSREERRQWVEELRRCIR